MKLHQLLEVLDESIPVIVMEFDEYYRVLSDETAERSQLRKYAERNVQKVSLDGDCVEILLET